MSGNVQVISRVATILNAMVERGASTLKELSDVAELPVSTTSRLLSSMQQVGFVERDPTTKEYGLGSGFLRMAALAEPRKDIASLLRPVLNELSATTTEDSAIAELISGAAVIIDRVDGEHPLRIIDRLNVPELLYVGAFRKVLLAYQEESWIEDYFERAPFVRYTDRSICDRGAMRDELRFIRERGYAYSFGERITDAGGIAAPIFGPTGAIRAAVQIAGPIARIDETTADALRVHVIAAARKCTERLGGSFCTGN
uniref:IclR family transcriptional regulator n=1 Tax=Aminobacter niigataensis TaxID=83265 RepID=UPI002852D590|nr:IclR family transcriptional regulator [Aminobacter niigataensis]WMD00123.1 IclR family transcriptional regulator [Aminobacter niigataensis]